MISSIYIQNVHKNRQWTQQLLETLVDTTDLILLQEPPRYFVKQIPSGTDPLGTPEHDTCHHAKWSKIFFHSNVSVYVNERVLATHNLFLHPTIDENIIAFSLEEQASSRCLHFVNCYNDLAKPTFERLITFLDSSDLPNLFLAGDFNLHSPFWDAGIARPDNNKATTLLNRATNMGLILLKESHPGRL